MLRGIWAQSLDGVIGDGDTMPWHLPEDLAHFKATTLGEPIIMGRATWESLPFRPLPGRDNLVLSSRPAGTWSKGAQVITELPDAGWVIGGGQVYAAALPQLSSIHVTLIDALLLPALGTRAVTVPKIGPEFAVAAESEWLTSARGSLSDGAQPLRYKFITYVKDAA